MKKENGEEEKVIMEQIYEEKYRIEEELGSGGSGVVYRVYDRHLDSSMAMKVFKKGDEISLQEMEILKELRHPALPTVRDCMEDEEYRYLIMEYMEGKTLKAYVEEKGTLGEAQAVSWALELCDILIYLHERENPIIYLDMKPANIIIDREKKIRLVDFGTACRIYGHNQERYAAIGTYGYGAPEQFETGRGRIEDERCDIYGLGATLFYMLTGCDPSRPPYLMLPIGFYQEGLSYGLERVVDRAVKREKEQRFQSTRELKEALKGYRQRDCLKKYFDSGTEKIYRGIVILLLFYMIYRCRQLGAIKGFTVYPELFGRENTQRELMKLFAILLTAIVGRKIIGSVKKNGLRIIKNVLLTEKKGKGLLAFIMITAGALVMISNSQQINVWAREQTYNKGDKRIIGENNLTVNVRNEMGQKILIRYDAVYTPENTLRLELPLSNFERGEEYELRLECTNRETKEKTSRIFYLKGLEP